jgi:hypothetical protein
MTKSIEIEKLLVQKIQTLEKETNTDPIELPNHQKLKKDPINNIQNRFGCLIIIPITIIFMTKNNVKRNINNVLLTNN